MSGTLRELESLLVRELGRVVVGADAAIRALVIALVARGHVLVQGVPGLGKTLLAKTLARALGGEFKRIQGTSDLMPSDIIGVHVFDESQRDFIFRPGPLFADVVLVDEINRAGPKTQSALLEAMEERQVSVERSVLPLPADFLVLATQNPRNSRGHTRCRNRSSIGSCYESMWSILGVPPKPRFSHAMAECLPLSGPPWTSVTVLERSLLAAARAEADSIHVAAGLMAYVLDIAAASREHPRLSLGLSTRGALVLLKAARIVAGLRGGEFVTPDDVKAVATWVMAHRLVLTPEAALEGSTDVDVVRGLLAATPVPR